MQRIAEAIIYFYRKFVSPYARFQCKFYPSCSQYALLAIKKYGFVRGTIKALLRMMKCRPLGSGGIDFP
ncbi:MAG: membrane protein insertion efficiency factor YidD [Holosporaceae bacterium]|jgi:putative membrane protein insertion efficiency factor|nr:membrane protein insertion efficiency factor YidD [Holosporaceae bacterium]